MASFSSRYSFYHVLFRLSKTYGGTNRNAENETEEVQAMYAFNSIHPTINLIIYCIYFIFCIFLIFGCV